MKQVININYRGRIIPIEVSAYEILKSYIESLNRYFINEVGKEEIINDIEDRIGELFQERLTSGNNCITDADVNAIISSMGTPEDFDLNDDVINENNLNSNESKSSQHEKKEKRLFRNEKNKIIGGVCAGLADYFNIDITAVRLIFVVLFLSFGFGLIPYIILWIIAPNSTEGQIGATRKKLYRDGEHKLVGGVCSGLSEFFGIDVWIPRVLFILPFLANTIVKIGELNLIENFLPGVVIAYLICWIVLPEAKTTSEKLEMKGEKIDLKSIKNTINEEMKSVSNRVKNAGAEMKQEAEQKSKGFIKEVGSFLARVIQWMVKGFVFIIKFVVYTILICMGIALIASLLGVSIGSFAFIPFKDYLLNGIWQNLFAAGTLLFFLLLSLIALIVWLIKKIAGIKTKNKWLTTTFITLWILGWISLFGLTSTLGNDFASISHRDQHESVINIQQPSSDLLSIQMRKNPLWDENEKNFSLFDAMDLFSDSIYITNVKLKLIHSLDDSFHIRVVTSAHGRSRNAADTTASNVHININQQDSIINVDQGFFITKRDKFRNQQVVVLISVPNGKRIKLINSNPVNGLDDDTWEFEENSSNKNGGNEYQMTSFGLTPIEEIKNLQHFYSDDSIKQNKIDSLIKSKEKIENQINKKKIGE